MKKMILLSGLLCSFFCVACVLQPKKSEIPQTSLFAKENSGYDSLVTQQRFMKELGRIKNYLKSRNSIYSNEKAILIDMRLSSQFFRLFVVDLKTDSIISRGMVAHGAGSEIEGTDSLQFSNTPNSYMTSLGMYKIGASYEGSFGRSYKLHGLEKSNSQAFARAIVLHRYQCVPDSEQVSPICNSLGCAMVSENYFETLAKIIDGQRKPMLLSIYY